MPKKFKRFGKGYAGGGMLDDNDGDEPVDTASIDTSAKIDTGAPSLSATPDTFGAAFRAARGSEAKTFTWRGKSYTTQTKEEAGSGRRSAPAAASRPAARASSPAPKVAAPRAPAPASAPMSLRMGAGLSGIPNKPSVRDVTTKDNRGNAVSLSADQRRKLQEAVARSGTRSSGLKSGGSVSGRGNGIARKGHAKGKIR